MCTLQIVVTTVVTIIGKIIDPMIQPVVRYVGLPFHYKKNLNNLEAEIKNLEEKRGDIQQKVDQANTRGEEVDGPVSRWLDKAEREVEEFKKDDKTVKENIQCFKFSCPNYISRYRMSKEAKLKINEVKNLTDQSSNFSTVAHPKPLPEELQFLASANYASFESRKLVFNNIIEALKDSNVKMIGVYGPGGVGKTTMIEEVGKQVKNGGLFDEVVKAVVSQDAHVSQIQGQLADRLSLKLNVETEVGKAGQLWNRLNNGKKNLILLDDMWQELDLKTIGIPVTEGCKVVITSRIQGVLKNVQVDREFSIQILSEEEAWTLFKKKVGNYVDSDQELHDIAVAVCKECQGLPVVILAVGAILKDKRKYAWEDALDQLKDSMLKHIVGIDPKVYASLKLSYDWLESDDAKSCFLLCCFFPEDAEISIEDLARHCIARRLLRQNPNTLTKARHRVLAVVDILKAACLLLEGTNENIVKMHDVIRDVALSIAKDDDKAIMVKHSEQEWPEKHMCESYSTISLRLKNIHELPNDLVCPQLHTLNLRLPMLNVPDRFFSGMEKLTVLELNKVHMLRLPSSLANLVNLRMLCLNRCHLEDITILKDLKNNLEILSLRDSNIRVLPSEIGQLTRLRLLDLGNCKQLTEIPQGVLSNLSRLEELYMLGGFNQWEATTFNKERSSVSLVELSKLAQVTTLEIEIPNVILLPTNLRFENLIRFKISMGGSSKIYENNARIFKFKGVFLRDELNVLLETVEMIHLENLEGLREMQSYRLDTSRSFNKLTDLRIEDCRLKYLFSPSCARGLPQLQQLRIEKCEIMEEIVGIEDKEELTSQVINFSQLKCMCLMNLPNLISFYPKMEKATTSDGNSSTQSLFNDKFAFPALEELRIETLPNITKIWDKKLLPSGSFFQLTKVEVKNCEKLVNVVSSNMLSRLRNLSDLSVIGCQNIEVIALEKGEAEEEDNDNIILLPQLRCLRLENLLSLKSFCASRFEAQCVFNNQVALPALKELRIVMLPNITEIWDKKLLPSGSFCQLTTINVQNCEKLMNIASSNMLSRLRTLSDLTVWNCQNMEVIALVKGEVEEEDNDNIISLPQLRCLWLENLQSFKSFCTSRFEAQCLFNNQVAFPALVELYITNLPNIIEIWDEKLLPSDSFCHLTGIWVNNCKKLVNVVSSNMLSRLWNLRDLSVTSCENMEVIALENGEEEEEEKDNDNIISFPQLRKLRLEYLRSLKSFCTSRFQAQCLFNNQVALPALEVLGIETLPNITEIWDKKLLPSGSFCQLTKVKVKNCEKLVNVVSSNMLSRLQNLRDLTVQNCQNMEVIALEKGEAEEEDNDNIISLPQLRCLRFENLQSLKSFCTSRFEAQCLFNNQVAFPALVELHITNLPNITEIWDEKLLPSDSFCHLTNIHIFECEKVVNIFSSNMLSRLWNLRYLSVTNCLNMEVIALEKGEAEEEDNDNIISFPQLWSLSLRNLQSLKSFCTSRFEAQCLFNNQVAFPALVELDIRSLPNITEIWDKKLLPSDSFCHLTTIWVANCETLVNVVSSNMLSRLRNLSDFRVTGCQNIEVIALEKGEAEEEDNDNIISLPQLWCLQLENLLSLKSFCASRFEAQCLFNNQVAFPKLEDLIVRDCGGVTEVFQLEGLNVGEREGQHVRPLTNKLRRMELDSLPGLTCLWNKEPRGIIGLQNLQYLVIKKCSLLRNLFTCSTALGLQQLKLLYLESCTVMEQVVATDEGRHKEEVTDDDEIEFLKLEWLILKDLPNLNSFCSAANCNFKLPSLKRVVLKRCPKMQTFTSGRVCMSQVLVSTRGNEGLQTEDLNKYLIEQRLVKEEEKCSRIDENDYNGEEDSLSNIYLAEYYFYHMELRNR